MRAVAQGEGEPSPARVACGGGGSVVVQRRDRRLRGSSGRRLKQAVAAAAVEARRQRAGETPAWEADKAGRRASPRPEAAEVLAGRVLQIVEVCNISHDGLHLPSRKGDISQA